MDPKLFVFQTINMASTSKEPLIPRIFIFWSLIMNKK
jgi:hypothetical protein